MYDLWKIAVLPLRALANCRGFFISGVSIDLDLRISRWILEAQRRGVRLERILIHPDDYPYARKHMRFLPVKVIGNKVPVIEPEEL